MNYFELFNLAPGFHLDVEQLAHTYQRLQQITHPDKFASAGDRERLLAVQKNAQVNDAYQTLKSPLKRAEYLLSLRGLDLQHEHQTMQDSAFLMQQMQWREELEDIEHADDPAEQLVQLDKQIKHMMDQQFAELAEILQDNGEEANLAAANLIRKLKFMLKLRHEIELKDDMLNDF